ncbi:MAG: hypothetical protein AAFR35_00675 [Pseudomonadota bacterium]
MEPSDQIRALFTRSDGSFLFARWARPIVPVVFGVDDATLSTVKGAIEAVVLLAGHRMAETDPELGANFMLFFVRDWIELTETPGLDRLVPELGDLVPRLKAAEANQYRFFRFDSEGGIKACFAFVCMDAHMSEMPAETVALGQAAQAILLWSDQAFTDAPPLARAGNGTLVLRPDIGDVIRTAYDPILPAMATDPSHALRIAARLGPPQ